MSQAGSDQNSSNVNQHNTNSTNISPSQQSQGGETKRKRDNSEEELQQPEPTEPLVKKFRPDNTSEMVTDELFAGKSTCSQPSVPILQILKADDSEKARERVQPEDPLPPTSITSTATPTSELASDSAAANTLVTLSKNVVDPYPTSAFKSTADIFNSNFTISQFLQALSAPLTHVTDDTSPSPAAITTTVLPPPTLSQSPIVLDASTDTISSTLQAFSKFDILAAPVRMNSPVQEQQTDAEANTKDENSAFEARIHQELRMVDVLDIAVHFLLVSRKERRGEEDIPALQKLFMEQPIGEVCNQSCINRLKPIKMDTPFTKIIESFSSVAHRAVVLDESTPANVLAIVTQYDVVRFLVNNLSLLLTSPLAAVKAGDVMRSDPFLVAADSTLYQSLRTLVQKRYSAAGVTEAPSPDVAPKLIGNLSISDLRGISQEHFFEVVMKMNLKDFLLEMNNTATTIDSASGNVNTGGAKNESDNAAPEAVARTNSTTPSNNLEDKKTVHPVTCFVETRLDEVMEKMIKEHVHRVWVVDQFNHPIGLVSMGDVLSSVYDIFCNNNDSGAQPLQHTRLRVNY